MSKGRRYDPARKQRIIETTLDIIVRDGVSGATHRRIATAADVPLGSMTYHFEGMEDLLTQAFTHFADEIAQRFEKALGDATTREEADQAVVGLICGQFWKEQGSRSLTLSYELYAYANRNVSMKAIMQTWMQRSHQALCCHYDEPTARIIDAMIEGFAIHRSVNENALDEVRIRRAISTITATRY